MQTTVTTKGQVTIPKQLRDRFGIRPGDRVEMAEEGGRVVLRPVRTLRDLRGAVRAQGVPVIEERALAKAAVARRVMGETEDEADQNADADRAAEERADYGQGRPGFKGRRIQDGESDQDRPNRDVPGQHASPQHAPGRDEPSQVDLDQDNPDQDNPNHGNPDQDDPNHGNPDQRDPDLDAPDQRDPDHQDPGAGR